MNESYLQGAVQDTTRPAKNTKGVKEDSTLELQILNQNSDGKNASVIVMIDYSSLFIGIGITAFIILIALSRRKK